MKLKIKSLLVIAVIIFSTPIYGNDSLNTQIILKYNNLEQKLNSKIENEIILRKKENIKDNKVLNQLSKRIDNLAFTEWLIGGIVGTGITLVLSLIFIPIYIRKRIVMSVSASIGIEDEKIQNIVLKNNRINKLKSNLN